MPLELLVQLAARIRNLNDAEFEDLERLVTTGDERVEHLDAATQCLADCLVISGQFEKPRPKTLRYVDGW